MNHVLQKVEGHYLRGYGDRTGPATIRVMDGADALARQALAGDVAAQEVMTKVMALVDGYESPYGLELLTTLHFVATHHPAPARSFDEAVAMVRSWSDRKSEIFNEHHLRVAWEQLVRLGWVAPDRAGQSIEASTGPPSISHVNSQVVG